MKTSSFLVPTLFLSLALSPCGLFAASDKQAAEFEQAAQAGDAEAQFQLARVYLRGTGVAKDPAKAFDLMKIAANQGHAEALGGMGYFYAMGVTVPQDKAAAVTWFRKGAEKGSARAQFNLGLALAKGNGTPVDETEGLRWIDAAANQGLADAILSQGESYFSGQFGRPINYEKAFFYFEKGAQTGDPNAENNLGVMWRDGLGTPKNEQTALDWFRKAAQKGQARAQSNLGHLLGPNSADRATRLEALMWLILATDQKEITAVKTFEELQSSVAKEELAEAQKAAEEFHEKFGV